MKWDGRRGKALGRNESDATPRLKKGTQLGSFSKPCFVSRHVCSKFFFNGVTSSIASSVFFMYIFYIYIYMLCIGTR